MEGKSRRRLERETKPSKIPDEEFDGWLQTVGQQFAGLNDNNKNRYIVVFNQFFDIVLVESFIRTFTQQVVDR